MKTKWLMVLLAGIIGLITKFLPLGLNNTMSTMLGILLFCGVLWFTEAVELHVTALLIPALLVIFLGMDYGEVLTPFFDPVIALMLGGFILARGMQKHGLDDYIANKMQFGKKPEKYLISIMIVTAFLSMWMSNTATTALMLPIALIVLKKNKLNPLKSNFGKSLVLGIAFSATIGGIATLVGSPPNIIAAKFLADKGIELSFVDWMAHALPITMLLLPVAWLVLIKVFKPEIKKITIKKIKQKLTKQQKQVLAVFTITAILWLTTTIHGYSSSLIAIVPIISLHALGLIDNKDFSKINWSALILLGGGLSLGLAIQNTGLDAVLAQTTAQVLVGQELFLIVMALALIGVVMTIVSSNTATAAILVPLVLPLGLMTGIDLKTIAVIAGISVSLDFIVPVGTPPSTIAYSSGYIKIWDMAKAGIIISTVGIILLTLFGMSWII